MNNSTRHNMKNDENLKQEFKNKVILITGGTGSIGLGIIKQLIKFQPKQIRIFSNDENSIVEVKEDKQEFCDLDRKSVV